VVSACVAQLLPFAKQTAHALNVLELQPAPSVVLDKVLVRRVVSNLLVNACRHTPAGSTIEVTCETADDGTCSIVVADDGPGVPQAIREAIATGTLRPRADAGAFADSGLGLPFCQMACRRMGGALEVQPSRQRGTRLVVRLPLGTVQEASLLRQD
jgi:signal transduction histidine kinase